MNNKSFDSKRIALGYAKRPWLHKQVIEQLIRDCGHDTYYKFKNGLDVGCGAGLSTKALRLICDKVTGTDIADSMVEVCTELYGDDKAYSFYVAKAEETLVPDTKYDIVTAAGCINWVDDKKFMENMLELGIVFGPVVAGQHFDGGRLEAEKLAAQLHIQVGKIQVRQGGNFISPAAKRRQRQFQGRQPGHHFPGDRMQRTAVHRLTGKDQPKPPGHAGFLNQGKQRLLPLR